MRGLPAGCRRALLLLLPASPQLRAATVASCSVSLFAVMLVCVLGGRAVPRVVVAWWVVSACAIVTIATLTAKVRRFTAVPTVLGRHRALPQRSLIGLLVFGLVLFLAGLAAPVHIALASGLLGPTLGALASFPPVNMSMLAASFNVWITTYAPRSMSVDGQLLLHYFRCACCSVWLQRLACAALPLLLLIAGVFVDVGAKVQDPEDCPRPLRAYLIIAVALLLSFSTAMLLVLFHTTPPRRRLVLLVMGSNITMCLVWSLVGMVWGSQSRDCSDVALLQAARVMTAVLFTVGVVMGTGTIFCRVEAMFNEKNIDTWTDDIDGIGADETSGASSLTDCNDSQWSGRSSTDGSPSSTRTGFNTASSDGVSASHERRHLLPG